MLPRTDSPDRWDGITRPYTGSDVERLQSSIVVEHTLARAGAQADDPGEIRRVADDLDTAHHADRRIGREIAVVLEVTDLRPQLLVFLLNAQQH